VRVDDTGVDIKQEEADVEQVVGEGGDFNFNQEYVLSALFGLIL